MYWYRRQCSLNQLHNCVAWNTTAHHWDVSKFPLFSIIFLHRHRNAHTDSNTFMYNYTPCILFHTDLKSMANPPPRLTVNTFLPKQKKIHSKSSTFWDSIICALEEKLPWAILNLLHVGLHLSGEAGWEDLWEKMRPGLWGRSWREQTPHPQVRWCYPSACGWEKRKGCEEEPQDETQERSNLQEKVPWKHME